MTSDAHRPTHGEPAGEVIRVPDGDDENPSPDRVGSVMQPTPSRALAAVRLYLDGIQPASTVPALAMLLRHGIDLALTSYKSTPADQLAAVREVLTVALDYADRLAGLDGTDR